MDMAILVLLFLVLIGGTKSLAVPPPPRTLHPDQPSPELIKRNSTTASEILRLNMDPDLVDPLCGGVYPANINVQYAPDPFYLRPECNKVLDYIGGNKGRKDVDIIITCTGQPTSGFGTRDVKVVLNGQTNSVLDGNDSGVQELPANMELVSEKEDLVLNAIVKLGARVNTGNGKITFQYIYC